LLWKAFHNNHYAKLVVMPRKLSVPVKQERSRAANFA
jgi:hypothetical protein